jgi:hypothetical protein
VVEDIDRTAPHVDVTEIGLLPVGTGENVHRREAIDLGGHPVPEINSLLAAIGQS